jgi:16S rRNA (guanine527-N7)-methyltransferase
VRLLLAWTEAINLTAIRDPATVARLHVLDSLAAATFMRDAGVDSFLDLGSGGGYPGLPLALALPRTQAVLIDSVAKKTAFLATVATATGLDDRVRVIRARAEDLAGRTLVGYDAVTARAVAALPDLVELALPLLRPGGRLVAWKRLGDTFDDELRRGRIAVDALGGAGLEVRPVDVAGLESHRLVVAAKRRPTPPGYPRPPAERARRPW